jgi:hypothetical protein
LNRHAAAKVGLLLLLLKKHCSFSLALATAAAAHRDAAALRLMHSPAYLEELQLLCLLREGGAGVVLDQVVAATAAHKSKPER